MGKTNIRILGIAPYEGLHTTMKQAAQAFPDLKLDIYTGDLEDGASIVKRIPPDTYDCIISRGGTASLIRQVSTLPVVEINLSVYDVLRTMKLAENYSSHYAIVGFPGITEPAHTLCDLLGSKLEIVTIHHSNEVYATLNCLKREGCSMVICDMVTHTVARKMDLNALLITSGIESLHTAIKQAVEISSQFRALSRENKILRSLTYDQSANVILQALDGTIVYTNCSNLSRDLSDSLRKHQREIPDSGTVKFYQTDSDYLYSVTAQILQDHEDSYFLFYCVPSRIPIRSHWSGMRFMSREECEYSFKHSFYNISGAMGTMSSEIRALSTVMQPIMIQGEPGTGKEQIARFLYLHSSLSNKPFVLVNCELMDEKSWDFFLGHYNSPLVETGNTIYFQNFELIPESCLLKLMDAITETDLSHRVRLIFSCVCYKDELLSETARHFCSRLGCQMLNLPTLRSRSDEIPSLASLYLANLNIKTGKQISGFEPHAIEMLCQYDWPTNNTQFKHVLEALSSQTSSTYIQSTLTAEILARERSLQHSLPKAFPFDTKNRKLDDIIKTVVLQAIADHDGNRTAAAKQLGISRTTIWRYLERKD